MAEAIFREKIRNYQDYCRVSSCGLAAFPNDPASDNAIKVLAQRGMDLSSHRARSINPYILAQADKIVCLAESHLHALAPLVSSEKLLLLGKGIPDPYGGDERLYSLCADAIEQAIEELLSSDAFFSTDGMRESDIPDVAAIECQNFSMPWSENAFREQLQKAHGACFVERYLGKPIGYLCMDNNLGEVYLDTIAVDEPFRRRGAAGRLLAKAMDFCRSVNAELLTLEVRVSNLPAQKLYEKFGFLRLGVRRNFYAKPNEDAYIMTKYLNGDYHEDTGN